MWDIAAEFGAMLVFAEHRYYGDSLPFGEESKSKDPAKVCEARPYSYNFTMVIRSLFLGWLPVFISGSRRFC